MLGKKIGAGALAGFATLALSLPSSAPGAVTIGSNLTASAGPGLTCSASPCTVSQSVLPAANAAAGGLLAPSDGVVVRWRIKVAAQVSQVALRITRPGDSATRTGAGTGPTVTPSANATSTFDVRLPIERGDALGLNCCQFAIGAFADTNDGIYRFWNPVLFDGSPPTPSGVSGPDRELLINADIEPDVDADGYGDETQDGCSTTPLRQDDCVAPQTTITKDAPRKTRKAKVKFKFASDDPGAEFECKLDNEPFEVCGSPKTVRRLDEGKHKFKVRAIDAAGNVDTSPAKDKFKVVD